MARGVGRIRDVPAAVFGLFLVAGVPAGARRGAADAVLFRSEAAAELLCLEPLTARMPSRSPRIRRALLHPSARR